MIRQFQSASLAALLLVAATSVRGETIRTIDDKTTTGTIKGFEQGALVIDPKSGGASVKIPLAEVVEIVWRPVAAKPQPKVAPIARPAPSAPSSPLAAIGNLLSLPIGLVPDSTPAAEPPVDDSDSGDNPSDSSDSQPTVTAGYSAVPVLPAQPVGAPQVVAAVATSAPAAEPQPAGQSGSAPQAVAPVIDSRWRVEFAGGDRAGASKIEWTGARVKLALDSLAGMPLETPAEELRAIWSNSAALVKKATDQNLTAQAQDIAFVEKDGDVKPVTGVAAGIEGDHLRFQYEGEERKIKLDRLVGLLFAQRERAAEKSLYEAFSLVNGDVLSGRIDSISGGSLKMKPLATDSAAIEIPLDKLASLDVKNGRLTWLGDLKPAAVTQVPYFDRLMPYRVNQSLTGGPLFMADGPITKGIAVHTRCLLAYNVDGGFERLRAKVGFQLPEARAGQAAVRITGDGKVLWSEANLKGDASKPAAVDIDISGVKTLSLEADYGPSGDVAGRVIWGEARLVKAASK